VQEVASLCLGSKIPLDLICSNEYGGFNPSGGQRQLIAWTRFLVRVNNDVDYIILDEPTSALDGIRERTLMEKVLEAGPSVVYITHKGSIAQLADYILLLRTDGTSIFGESKELIDHNEFRELFG
jgi:competence factor transporting protein